MANFEHLFRICVCSSQIFGRKCTAQRFIVKSIFSPGSVFFFNFEEKKVSKVLCASSVCSLWVIICDQSGRFSSALEKKLQKVVNFGKISLFF